MAEETGIWLSTSRPPKQQTSSKIQKSVLKPCNKTTTFFSATLTQNSPPPPQLFTSRKQSYLTDYYKKGCENAIHCVNTPGQTNNVIDTAADIDSMLFKQQPIVKGFAEHEMVGASSDKCTEKRKSTNSCDDHQDKLQSHFTHVTFTPSNDIIKDSIQNEDFYLIENPTKVLRLELDVIDVNTSRFNANTSLLEDLTNSQNVKSNSAGNSDFSFGHETSSLSFTQTQTSLDFNSKDDSFFNGSEFNKDVFHARKQKHYRDMETLQFTEDPKT